MTDLMIGLGALAENFDDYEIAETYYEGCPDELIGNAQLRRLLVQGGYGERFRINLAKTPVDALLGKVQISSITTDSEAGDAALALLREDNLMELQEGETHRRTFEYGDAYLIVWPDAQDDDTEDGDRSLAASKVQISYNSPQTVRMIYDDDHPNRKKFAVKSWFNGSRWRADLYYPDRIEPYISKTKERPTTDDGWEPYTEDEGTWPLVNPYGEIPVFHFRNGLPYGRPEHKDAYAPQDAVNKIVATQMASTDSQGFPQRYGLLDPEAVLNENNDDPFRDNETEVDSTVDASRKGQRSGLRGGPGTMLFLAGLKEVGQFATADSKNFMDPLEVYVRLMAQVTTTPLHYFDPSGDQPSGESLRAADAPLIAKARNRKQYLTPTWQDVYKFALKLMGVVVASVDVQWAPDTTIDDVAGWEVIEKKIANGVTQDQALREAGYTDEQVENFLDANQEEMALQRRIELLNSTADAIQKLGAGVATGVISQQQVDALITRIIGEQSPGTEE
jgi:hypothetical protein